MSIVEVKKPLVFIDEELCWFVLKSPDISRRRDFHIILTELSDPFLQALKGFFLLLKNYSDTRAISVCLALDFSKVPQGGKCVEVYKSLFQNIGPEVTELRLSGMKHPPVKDRFGVLVPSTLEHLNVHPFSIQNPIFASTVSFPHLHTVRISNLGGKENIMWLSYFLNAARNLEELHIGPFAYVQVKELGRLDIDTFSMHSPSHQFDSVPSTTAGQLRLLGQCTNFEKMPGAQLFITKLSLEPDCSIPSVRTTWDGTPVDKIGLGIPLPMKVHVVMPTQVYRDTTLINVLCTPNHLTALSGLNRLNLEPKLLSSFPVLAKLEIESSPPWLLENLENFPNLNHLVWRPMWTWQDKPGYGEQKTSVDPKMMSDLRAEAGRHQLYNVKIFRIVQDRGTSQKLPEFYSQFLELFSLSFPKLKTLSCEVGNLEQVSALLENFPQIQELHLNQYVRVTEISKEIAPPIDRRFPHQMLQTLTEYSYKLENFRQKMSYFEQEVESRRNICSRDGKSLQIKIGAFIYLTNLRTPESVEMNIPEVCSTISQLNLCEVVIPVINYGEAVVILEAITSTGSNDLKHVHFQILRSSNPPTQGIPQHIIDYYEPFFFVTYDFEQYKNNLSCSSLVKDFWE